MIRKLRIRFIRTAMLAVILVLFLIIGGINILNYRNVVANADTLLKIMCENDSGFPGDRRENSMMNSWPDDPDDGDPGWMRGGQGRPGESDADKTGENSWEEELEEWNSTLSAIAGGRGSLSKETPFESRYYSATLDADGDVVSFDISHIASINEKTLEEYAADVFSSSRTSGFIDQYRFLKTTDGGETTVLFLDCGRSLASFRSFLLMSVIVSVLGVLGVLILVILFSGRIIRPVQESYEKQKRFITDAGHELKTPLTIIDADVMVAEMENGESEWLTDIKAQTRRLSGLTNDLIYLSRMDEGSANMQMIDFPLSDVASEIVQSFRSRAQLEEKELTASIDPMITVCGDENSLRKLISILIDNAIKYASDKGHIAVSLHKKTRSVVLSVENDADHVDPDMLQHMFDRFYRADASRNSSQGGHGIGLSIAQAVVAAHRGTITAEAPTPGLLRITAVLPL